MKEKSREISGIYIFDMVDGKKSPSGMLSYIGDYFNIYRVDSVLTLLKEKDDHGQAQSPQQ